MLLHDLTQPSPAACAEDLGACAKVSASEHGGARRGLKNLFMQIVYQQIFYSSFPEECFELIM
jgi:hypothetical protein